MLPRVESVSQVQDVNSVLRDNSYSNSNLTRLNNSNSTVSPSTILHNLSDVVPDDDYMPFYVKRLKDLGSARFTELANKARQSGKDPKRLFFWMLKNNELVK